VSIGATGGLRPPLLYWCADVRRRNNDFCDAQTHIRTGAAGVSPPWFAEPNAVRLQPRYVRRRPERQQGAAGVSPPGVPISPIQSCSFATAGSRQPLLVARGSFAAKCVIRSAESHTRPGAAGVSPPWFAEPNAVRLQPRYVRRRPDRRPRAAGVSPPWVSVSLVQSCSFATAGLRQPLLVARRSFVATCVIRSAESHTQRERRASARCGPVNRALCRRNRVLFGDDRLHDRERRASARRG
jgi:hypothetical protein